MLLKNLLITTLWLVIPVTVVYAAIPLCGSDSAVVENWKGEYIVPEEELISTPEEMIYTLDEPGDLTAPSEFDGGDDLIVDEPDLIELETEE